MNIFLYRSDNKKNMEKNLDKMKPCYYKHILQVPWPFIILRFHHIWSKRDKNRVHRNLRNSLWILPCCGNSCSLPLTKGYSCTSLCSLRVFNKSSYVQLYIIIIIIIIIVMIMFITRVSKR